MPIIVVTEGDFAGITYDGEVSFELGAKPFRLVIPLSQLLDDKREEESVAFIYRQIPKNDDLAVYAYHFLLNKALKAGVTPKSAAENFAIKTYKLYNAHDYASFAYKAMKDEAAKINIRPVSQVTEQQIKDIKAGLATCKPWIADCAHAMDIRVSIVNEKHSLLSEGSSDGMSNGWGVYLSANKLKHTYITREEFQHHVDRKILGKKSIGYFSNQAAFVRAVSKDVENGKDNVVYRYLVSELPSFLIREERCFPKIHLEHFDFLYPERMIQTKEFYGKGNICLSESLKKMPKIVDKKEDAKPYAEALVDIYHMEAMVKALAEHKIKLGGVVGLGEDTTPDDVMRAAFPNTWPLLEGPGVGRELVQFEEGRVKEIPKDSNFPEGASRVTSLREHCEAWLKQHERIIAEDVTPSDSFASKTQKRSETHTQQKKDKPKNEHYR